MERFFILDKYNTWYDWRLYLTSKTIEDAEPNTKYVNIEGMSGSLDLSDALTGEITYQDRNISATFWTDTGTYKERGNLLRSIVSSLHGKKIKIIEPDDPSHYFYGRVKVKSQQNIIPYAEFSIEATCEPWRYAIDESVRYAEVNNDDISLIINNNGVKSLSPDITVTGTVTITTDDMSIELTDGNYKISNFKLAVGANNINVSGQGTITFRYREVEF